ncbi:ABC transporter substrate-binding protein [Cellulomonas carbonis]|uniref:ABC transporter substrate-binding protein n=1 Tax=Cellulomonas carbonis T26 TaxID=947969 RepID=A0A0A0BMV6_9CELL|nr:iron-siderophore ABC transporter substrate-binding protein [Cellulomonas carbonis]KGM09220.1 ABC transporter substrate-binding protein [Cellulomonas carbonis T26]GGC07885.1 ABC transporter substrate-binding protein [Cellulomonas carbonis]
MRLTRPATRTRGASAPEAARSARRPVAALATIAVVGLLAACGTTEEPAEATGATTDDRAVSDAGPVTVTDERGEVMLDAPAVDVVSLEWGLTENLLSLGVVPVGQADVAGYNTWATVEPLDASVPDVGFRGEPSLDAIAALDADLVVTTTDLPDAVIAQIEESVPVLALRGSDAEDPMGYLRRTVETLAEVTGTQDRGEDLLADFDAALADGRAALADAGLEGAPVTMADGWDNNGVVSVRMFTGGSFFGALLGELGLENAWTGEGDPDYGLSATDVEGLTALDDVHFVYAANAAETDPFAEGLADNPVWQKLPFVTSGQVHRIPDGIWMFGGPASGTAFVDAVVAALTE